MRRQRMTILADGEFDPDQARIADSYRVDGNVINVVRLFARFMDFFRVYKPFGLHGMIRAKLTPRYRELAILTVAALNRSDYEWGHHSRIAHGVGLSWAEIGKVRDGIDEGLTADDALIVRATRMVRRDADLDDETYDALLTLLGEAQLFELLVAVGNYNMVSTILNVAGVPLEAGVRRLSDPLPVD